MEKQITVKNTKNEIITAYEELRRTLSNFSQRRFTVCFNTGTKRKKELDLEVKEKRASFEKEIAEREAKVSEAEQELLELKVKSEKFPKDIEKQLTKQRTEGEMNLKNQTIYSLKTRINEQDTFIKELTSKSNTESNSFLFLIFRRTFLKGSMLTEA